MKPRHMIFINVIFIGLMLFSAAMVYQFMTGRKPLSAVSLIFKDDKPLRVTTTACSERQPISGLPQAASTGLHKLALYQQACHSFVSDTQMVFVGMPTSQESADKSAKEVAVLLKDYAKYGVRPLIIAEPTDYDTSVNIDFNDFASGKNDAVLAEYFKQLKTAGISDAQMGIWNPFPEANLPYWQNNKPELFAPAVNHYIAALRKVFPSTKTSIMLNSATYEMTDFDWENGDYASWLPYIKGLTAGSINYVGMQGFPWVSAKGGNGLIINAAEYLNPDLLSEAADQLKVKDVWYNTGSFGTKYALDPERTRTMPPEQRKAILATVTEQVTALQEKGYHVSVNLFAQDKSKTSEETDWSYWQGSDPFSSAATPVFTGFVQDMQDRNVPVWIFDK